MVNQIKIRGARVHNLKNIDLDVPLHKIVGILSECPVPANPLWL